MAEYFGGGGAGGISKYVRGATLVVAASDSKDTSNADYVCTGTDDQNTINTAISNLPSSGGTILLMEGNYNLSDYININKARVRLVGMGWGTYLNRGAGEAIRISNSDIMVANLAYSGKLNTSGTNIYNRITVRDILWKSSVDHTDYLIDIRVYRDGVIDHFVVDYGSRTHVKTYNLLHFKSSFGGGKIANCFFVGGNISSNRTFIWIEGQKVSFTNNIWFGYPNSSSTNNSYLVKVAAPYSRVANNMFFNYGGKAKWDLAVVQLSTVVGNVFYYSNIGIYVAGAGHTTVIGNSFYYPSTAIYLSNSKDCTLIGNTMHLSGGTGIYLTNNSSYNIVKGNSIGSHYYNSKAGTGIYISSDSDYNLIDNNAIYANTWINNNAPHTIIGNNVFFS